MKYFWKRNLLILLIAICIGSCFLCYATIRHSYQITQRVLDDGMSTEGAFLYLQTDEDYLFSAAKETQTQEYFKTEPSTSTATTEAVRVSQPLNTTDRDAVGTYKGSIDVNHTFNEEGEHYYNTSKSTNMKQIPKPKLYVFSLSYMDQLTWATTRLRSLQCWAGKLIRRYDAHVIEPFVTDTAHLGIPQTRFMNQSLNNALKFRDVFEISSWRQSASKGSYPVKITGWDTFLSSGARNVVIVQIIYPYHHDCTENEQTDEMCNTDRMQNLFSENLALNNFTLLKSICINFRKLGILNTKKFNDFIFNDIPKDLPVTVMFDEWRGLGTKSCIARVWDPTCFVYDEHFVSETLSLMTPSSRIKSAAQKYIDRYLPRQSGYVAIMIRWEKILLFDFYSYHNNSQHFSGSSCLKSILAYIFEKRNIKTFFLTTDIGTYGSSTFGLYNSTRVSTSTLTKYTQQLLKILNQSNSLHLVDYEQTFQEVSRTTNSAFISQLQKVIAARARCLLLVGWGSFLTNTLSMYRKMHSKAELCYRHITLC